ncbi:20677_t:CDS:2 [Gigaspora margarita]|uniref:20677_t:CDS:1 n=1 Tax=Gigaspora margarita TaxID=4874 RepID=A0ABM8VWF5_GIGMA|nr:20677_t:CDS:2 [Gigaspora margarita]
MLYFRYYIFAFLLNFILTFADFVPPVRRGHTSVLVDKKLYFTGGFNKNAGNMNDFFYLDVSKHFTITALPWNDLNFTGSLQNAYISYIPACSGGHFNDFIFIFGVLYNNFANVSFTYIFDISQQQWTIRNEPIKSKLFSCAKFYNGLSNATNAPSDILAYCAITLPDDTILYIGGTYGGGDPVPMNQSFLCDTESDKWKILVLFGGVNDNVILGDLWILNIESYQWSAGNISNPNGLTLWSHTANLVDNYMIVAFGQSTVDEPSQRIFMLDVS